LKNRELKIPSDRGPVRISWEGMYTKELCNQKVDGDRGQCEGGKAVRNQTAKSFSLFRRWSPCVSELALVLGCSCSSTPTAVPGITGAHHCAQHTVLKALMLSEGFESAGIATWPVGNLFSHIMRPRMGKFPTWVSECLTMAPGFQAIHCPSATSALGHELRLQLQVLRAGETTPEEGVPLLHHDREAPIHILVCK
jgi:hypothetical protein